MRLQRVLLLTVTLAILLADSNANAVKRFFNTVYNKVTNNYHNIRPIRVPNPPTSPHNPKPFKHRPRPLESNTFKPNTEDKPRYTVNQDNFPRYQKHQKQVHRNVYHTPQGENMYHTPQNQMYEHSMKIPMDNSLSHHKNSVQSLSYPLVTSLREDYHRFRQPVQFYLRNDQGMPTSSIQHEDRDSVTVKIAKKPAYNENPGTYMMPQMNSDFQNSGTYFIPPSSPTMNSGFQNSGTYIIPPSSTMNSDYQNAGTYMMPTPAPTINLDLPMRSFSGHQIFHKYAKSKTNDGIQYLNSITQSFPLRNPGFKNLDKGLFRHKHRDTGSKLENLFRPNNNINNNENEIEYLPEENLIVYKPPQKYKKVVVRRPWPLLTDAFKTQEQIERERLDFEELRDRMRESSYKRKQG